MTSSLFRGGRFLLAGWVLLALVAVPARAQTETEQAPPPAILELQLDWFMMPVTTATSSRTRTVPGTIFLRAKTENDIAPICVFEPRIRDAFLRVLFDQPILISKGRLKAETLYPTLVEAANSVMKEQRVTDVWVQAGVARAGRGDLKRLPFDSVQLCRDVRANEQKLLEQKNKKQ